MATNTLSNAPDIIEARILVVDDNPGTAATLARAIARISPTLKVISAPDGETALRQVSGEHVDLVITDMMMPGLNGLELIERLRKNADGNPLFTILMTAYDVPGLKESARRMRVDETLIKPIPPERVCQIVRKSLEKAQVARPTPGTGQKLRLLAADDNPSNLTLLARYLQQEEYELITASNGLETLEKTRAELPDLILLDVNMPEMDGFQVLEAIRSNPLTERIPVIIVTAARLDPVDMQYALNLGADDYVMKPFDRRELLARIRARLRVKEAEDLIRRRNRELNLLPEIGRELSAGLDAAGLADVILPRTVETLGAFMGHLALLEPQGVFHKTFRIPAKTQDECAPELPDITPFLKSLRETRQGFVMSDARWPVPGADSARSVVVAPIFGRSDLLGLLALAHEQPDYFTQEHLLLLQAIASQAAMALENARLFTSVKQEQQRLQAVLQNASDAILIFDAGKKISLTNAAAKKLFDNAQIEVGQPARFGGENNPLPGLIEKAQAANAPQSCLVNWPDKRAVNLLVTPIEDGYVATLRDIS